MYNVFTATHQLALLVRTDVINNALSNSSQEYQDIIKNFKENTKVLYDFSACKFNSFETCSCPKTETVPIHEENFLTDERYARKIIIGGVDFENTKILYHR